MDNKMPGLNDHLYLLEVLVDNVSVASNDDPDIAVQVQFGDIGTFVIRRTTANSSDPADVDIADGKCLLFSMRPAQLVSYMEQHPLKLTVLKMSTGETQCIARFHWDDSFLTMIQEPCPVEPNAQYETLDLMESVDEEIFIGFIEVLVRLSCHGKNIMSQFQRRMDIRGKDNIISKQEGMYHSDISPLDPVISTVEVSEGLVISMLPTVKPLTCVRERSKNPSSDIAEVFNKRDVLFEINDNLKKQTIPEEPEEEKSRESLRPCIKSFKPIEEKVKRFLASDPPLFQQYSKQPKVPKYKLSKFKLMKSRIMDPLSRAEKNTKNAVSHRKMSKNYLKQILEVNSNTVENKLNNICKESPGRRPVDEKQIYNVAVGKNGMPLQFVCQGGGCKDYIRKRKKECCKASTCVEGISCIPVPPCMKFNPCEYPTCLSSKPPGFTPCYLPPCPADKLCKPCKQSPWLSTVPGKAKRPRKKRNIVPTIAADVQTENAETLKEEEPKEKASEGSAGKKKRKNKRRSRKKCGGVCLSRGLDRYYNPRFRQGHRACVPELESPPGVPPNMGWLWTSPNPGLSFRPGWRPGAVHKKVFEIMCQLKDANEDDDEKDRKTREKRTRPATVAVAQVESPYVDIHKIKQSSMKVSSAGAKMQRNSSSINETDSLKQREMLLQKALTEVCKELCLNAYSDLFQSIAVDTDCPQEQPAVDIKALTEQSTEFDITPYAIKEDNEHYEGLISCRRQKYDSSDQESPVVKKVHCRHEKDHQQEKEHLERDSYVIQKEKQIKDVLNFESENSQGGTSVEESNSNRTCSHCAKHSHIDDHATCSTNYRQTCTHEEQSSDCTYSDQASLTTKTSSPVMCHKRHVDDTPDRTTPMLSTDTTAESLNSYMNYKNNIPNNALVPAMTHKPHCKKNINYDQELRLYDEMDRILRITDQADACKELMRQYIEDMEMARIAREEKFAKTNLSNRALKNKLRSKNSLQKKDTDKIRFSKKSRDKFDNEKSTSEQKLDTKKSFCIKNCIPVNSKVSSWLNKQPVGKGSRLSNSKTKSSEISTTALRNENRN